MSRFARLNKLIAEIRRLPSPVTAQVLADATGVSERTIYRDIETLRQSGAVIDGEAGYGYTLSEDPALPPFSFSRTEIEAIVLGLQSVGEIADLDLAHAAQAALTKLSARLPERARAQISHAILDAKSFKTGPEITIDQSLLRSAAWEERAVDLTYRDERGKDSARQVYPLSIIYLDRAPMLIAWCCLRQGHRIFRLDRMQAIVVSEVSFRPNRVQLLREAWAIYRARTK